MVITNIKTTPVLVPFRYPPVTASGAISELPLVLLDVETNVGLTGHAYLFVFLKSMLKPTIGCVAAVEELVKGCLLYTSPSPRDQRGSRMPSSA